MADITLYCLPYSGASAMVYSRWRRHVPAWLRVHPVELPGRGARMGEALHTDMRTLARQLAAELRGLLQPPYALFGHSLGALLAFELAHALRETGAPAPLAVFASGTAAPTQRARYQAQYGTPKSDAVLIDELRSLQGTPEEVLANAELMQLTLPILRADFLLCGRYHYPGHPALQVPLHVLGGRDDACTPAQLLAWELEAGAGFSLNMLPGGHFFIHTQEADVLALLAGHLQTVR